MQSSLYPRLALALIVVGASLLALSLLQIRRLISALPAGRIRRRWHELSLLALIFLLGYVAYAAAYVNTQGNWRDLLVPAVFLGGGGFVWLTARLALQTATDLHALVRLEQENITDPLLGIYNRRYLDRRLQEECGRAIRYKMPLSLLMVDIDHFKQVNDSYGHQIGDLALQHISRIVLASVRRLDVVARYGGEELVIVAPDTTILTAAELARRVNHLIAGQPFVTTDANGNQHAIRMTVSIGVASLDYAADTDQKLLARADEALYEAKHNGRNQVVTSDSCLGE